MYKRINVPVIEIEIRTVDLTCGACPVIFDFTDTEGTRYHFRLRHGSARIVCEDTNETLLSERMPGRDGQCDWYQVESWAKEHGIYLLA